MNTRRDFLKKAALFSGGVALSGTSPESIKKALSIDPEEGSTYLDAEHIVILMQENRSFDHCFGAYKGVRGFNDPRVMTQPDGNAVWLQTNKNGETYVPFRFDIKDTKTTWMGSIPHGRGSQVDANNYGRYDHWLDSKRSGHKSYKTMPLTLGHYNREDLPFHYSMADAFTICDHNFCSAMSSTWPNRLFFFAGNVRGELSGKEHAVLTNRIPWGKIHWKTMAEHLEENNVAWRFYQNALTIGGGLKGEERSWLANFSLNTLEKLSQFNTRFYDRYVQSARDRADKLARQINEVEEALSSMQKENNKYLKTKKDLETKKDLLRETEQEIERWSPENFEKLSTYQKNLYQKAFTTNEGNPDYMKLTTLKYEDQGTEREVTVPAGDPLFQFRKDVREGKLPTVTWLAPSQNFSDHPSAPWYGAWYVSEVLDILTENPEVWKKTIFITTYDENDGYFDHIPPFVPPNPREPETGKCSKGLNESEVEFAYRDRELKEGIGKGDARTGPSGLGYRVPMVIASPWSRGGKVCSEIFDHTSTLQFLEHFLNKKYGTNIHQRNISNWRRAVCGDLTSVFDRFERKKKDEVDFLEMNPFVEQIYNAKFKRAPDNFKALTPSEIKEVNEQLGGASLMSHQEPGVRKARPLPYQLYVDGRWDKTGKTFEIQMEVKKEVFGEKSSGSPFKVYAPGKYKVEELTYKSLDYKDPNTKDRKPGYMEAGQSWDYAVVPGDSVADQWPLHRFEGNQYHLRVHGPNGFFRVFKGDEKDPSVNVRVGYEHSRLLKTTLTGNVVVEIDNQENRALEVIITDESYHQGALTRIVPSGETLQIPLDLSKSFGWYDFSVTVKDYENFSHRFAGHVETGKESVTDPLMGKLQQEKDAKN